MTNITTKDVFSQSPECLKAMKLVTFHVKGMSVKLILSVLLVLSASLANISQVRSQCRVDVTVQVDQTIYMELVSITGNVTYQGELVQYGLIGVQVENQPDTGPTTTIVMRTFPLNETQSFPFSLETISLLPVDEAGNFKPSTKRGKYMWVNMTVKNKGLSTRDVYVSITILDSELIPLTTERASFPIPPGQTGTFRPRIYVPKWANVGTGYIYGNVYDSWPRSGGLPLCPEKTSNFDIEEPSSILPSEHFENGIYGTVFRLRPDMAWGTCRVYALAWSGGCTGYSTANFEYWLPGDFNKDGDVDLYDAVAFLTRYGSREGDPLYELKYDIHSVTEGIGFSDGYIGLYDAVAWLPNFGVKPPRD